MALIIEDGSIVAGANSYVTLDEVKAFATARGVTLPTVDAEIEPFAVLAFDYIESFRVKYQGQKTEPSQRTEFPRSGVVVDGYYAPSTEIPWQLKSAQCQAVIEAHETDLMPNSSPGVKREKVSVLEVEYQLSSNSLTEPPSFPKVDAFLAPPFRAGVGWRPKVVRG